MISVQRDPKCKPTTSSGPNPRNRNSYNTRGGKNDSVAVRLLERLQCSQSYVCFGTLLMI